MLCQRPSQTTREKKASRLSREDVTEYSSDENIFQVQQNHASTPPYKVKVKLDDASLEMKLDTGAATLLISKTTYDKMWAEPPAMKPTTVRLRTYSSQSLTVLGTVNVSIQYETQQVKHSILVVDGSGLNLFGRDLLAVCNLSSAATRNFVETRSALPPRTGKNEEY